MKVKELLESLRFTHNIEVRQDNDFVGYTDSSNPVLQSIYEREISNWFVHDGLGGKIDIVIDLKDTEAADEDTLEEAADQEESPAAADEKEYYKLGEDATLIFSIDYEYNKKTAYYDNTPTIEISSGYVGLGVSLDKEHKKHEIIMTPKQTKAVIKALKMQLKRLKN